MNLADWTKLDIDAACAKAYATYNHELAVHYTRYFEQYEHLRGDRIYCASKMEAALPSGWAHLANKIPESKRHEHHLSGKSSQTLALGLLGSAESRDPQVTWLWSLLGCAPQREISTEFEHELEPRLLNEKKPRVTSIDYLVSTPDMIVCVECKWAEKGIGSCSCGRTRKSREVDEADPTVGECSKRVLRRDEYWHVAREIFKLPPRLPPNYCPISTSYQAVRNVAAARVLAGQRKYAFVLIYDANNPYFKKCNEWPGWPVILEKTLNDISFRSISWQQLISRLNPDGNIASWAREKHQLAT
jgi:hypothetical protein